MKRRELLHFALLLPGFSLTVAGRAALGAVTGSRGGIAAHFSKQERGQVALLAELIIPETHTPGAIEAGVPAFIERIVMQWYDTEERNIFLEGLRALDSACIERWRKPFAQCGAEQQIALLTELEKRAAEATGNVLDVAKEADGAAPFILKLKELTAVGYYTSEIGATRELRYDPVPLRHDGKVPVDSAPRQSSW